MNMGKIDIKTETEKLCVLWIHNLNMVQIK